MARSPRGRAAVLGLVAVLLPVTALAAPAATASAADGGYTVSLIPTSASGNDIAVNSATDTIYLLSSTGVTVINGATGSVTTSIALAGSAEGIAVDSVTDTVYVHADLSSGASDVDVIDGATNDVTTAIGVSSSDGSGPGIAVDTATDTVYVTETERAAVAVIDGATNTVTGTLNTGTGTRPYGVAVDESTDVIWVTDLNGLVIEIDGVTDSVVDDITTGGGSEPESVAVNSGTDTLYVADALNRDVVVIDGATGTVSALVAIGASLTGVAVEQTAGTIYATSYSGEGTTWVIAGGSNKVDDTLARGGWSVAVDQGTGSAYEGATAVSGVWALTASATNAMSPVITSSDVAKFSALQAGTFTVAASALPAATFSVTDGTLPSGLALSPQGVLSGTPAAGSGGTYPITLAAGNGIAPASSQQLTVIVDQAPAITSGSSTTFRVGTAGSFPLTATGYPAPQILSTYGVIPVGVSITGQPSGGYVLSGTPGIGMGGVYQMTLEAYNGVASEAAQSFTLTVQEAPSFSFVPRTVFAAGVRVSYQIKPDGYPVPAMTETGALPKGVTLSAAGQLSGTPAAHSGGIYKFTVTATNSLGTASEDFALTVDQVPSFSSPWHATFKPGSRRTFTIGTLGFPVPRLSERGRLPKGIRFRARGNGTAVLTGTARRAGRGRTYLITITASNGFGGAARQTFWLKIS